MDNVIDISNNNEDIFSELLPEIIQLKANVKSIEAISNITKILNDFYPTCIELIVTNNTDNLFFGINTMPIVKPEDIANILFSDNELEYNISKYKVEIDSKLLSDLYGLDVYEITALLIYEVNNIKTRSIVGINRTRELIDEYLAMNNKVLRITDAPKLLNVLQFMIQESIRRTISIFHSEYSDTQTKIVNKLEIDKYLRSSIRKLDKTNNRFGYTVDSALPIIKWCLRLYTDLLQFRIPVLHVIAKSRDVTGSKYMRDSLDKLKESITNIDDDSSNDSANFNEATSSLINFISNSKKANLTALDRFKANGIKAYFDDFYEIQFEVNNMDDDRGLAIMLLHKINSRMNVIDDYMTTEENLSPATIKKLQELYSRYDSLRYEISSKKLKSPKTLLINYGDD